MSKAPALALLSLLLAVGSANAQAPTGTLTGLVLDASGAALAGPGQHRQSQHWTDTDRDDLSELAVTARRRCSLGSTRCSSRALWASSVAVSSWKVQSLDFRALW